MTIGRVYKFSWVTVLTMIEQSKFAEDGYLFNIAICKFFEHLIPTLLPGQLISAKVCITLISLLANRIPPFMYIQLGFTDGYSVLW